jgi:hypothetical protein
LSVSQKGRKEFMIRPTTQFGKSGLAHRLRAKHPQQRWACASFATLVFVIAVLVLDFSQAGSQDFRRETKIAFSSSRDNPTANPFLVAEIYLMDPDGGNPIRLTEDTGGANVFAALSPDGKKIVFDSNRHATEFLNPPPPPVRVRPVRDEHGRDRAEAAADPGQRRHVVSGQQEHRVPRFSLGHGAADQAKRTGRSNAR